MNAGICFQFSEACFASEVSSYRFFVVFLVYWILCKLLKPRSPLPQPTHWPHATSPSHSCSPPKSSLPSSFPPSTTCQLLLLLLLLLFLLLLQVIIRRLSCSRLPYLLGGSFPSLHNDPTQSQANHSEAFSFLSSRPNNSLKLKYITFESFEYSDHLINPNPLWLVFRKIGPILHVFKLSEYLLFCSCYYCCIINT